MLYDLYVLCMQLYRFHSFCMVSFKDYDSGLYTWLTVKLLSSLCNEIRSCDGKSDRMYLYYYRCMHGCMQ